MPAKVFLDSNVLIYVYSEDESEKAELALQCAQEQIITQQSINRSAFFQCPHPCLLQNRLIDGNSQVTHFYLTRVIV